VARSATVELSISLEGDHIAPIDRKVRNCCDAEYASIEGSHQTTGREQYNTYAIASAVDIGTQRRPQRGDPPHSTDQQWIAALPARTYSWTAEGRKNVTTGVTPYAQTL